MTRRRDGIPFDLVMIILVIPAMLCFSCTLAFGQTHAAVARIHIADPTQGNYYASGTLVDDDGRRGIILTVWHSFIEPSPDSPITAIFPDGRTFAAELVGTDSTWDLAALEIGTTGLTPLPIASEHAMAGDMLTSCGYGSPQERYWCNSGRAIGYGRAANQPLSQTLILSGPARLGDSGGPILNDRGELVAVVSGTNGRIITGTFVGRVRTFLANCRTRRGGQPTERPDCPPDCETCPESQPGPQPWQPSPILPRAPMEPVVPLPGPQAPDPVQIAEDPRVDELVTGLAVVETQVESLAEIAQMASNWHAELVDNVFPGIDAELDELHERVTTVGKASSLKLVEGPRGPPGPTGPPVDTARLDKIETAGRDAIAGLMPYLLGALGLGGATPAALAGLGIYRLLRRRDDEPPRALPIARSDPAPEPAVVRLDTPPPPQTVRRDREFVPYEAPNGRRKALEWAHDEYVKKYPGARATIETIEAYADQYESGMKKI